MREALARVVEAVDDCLDLPVWPLRGQELIEALDVACVAQRKAAALLLSLVREVDGSGLAREQGATSTAAWLRHRLRLSPGAARLLVGDAERWESGPALVRDAVAAGRVSVEQARVIGKSVDTVGKEAGVALTGDRETLVRIGQTPPPLAEGALAVPTGRGRARWVCPLAGSRGRGWLRAGGSA